ncbi:MAG: DUF975 family protein [Clostridia bacterium]|nr:DUF975 family protein [Clostridia bacterium]
MKTSAEYRASAREALTGHWLAAAAAGVIAVFFGAETFEYLPEREELERLYRGESPAIQALLFLLLALLAARVLFIFLTGGASKIGLSAYHLALVDGRAADIREALPRRDRLQRGIGMALRIAILQTLWSLLFVIPGIVKGFAYALTPYLLAEAPEMRVRDAMAESERRMMGHKWRLFCLRVSFFGWQMLEAAAMGFAIASLKGESWGILTLPLLLLALAGGCFLDAYRHTAEAAFVRDLPGGAAYA